jgi:putative membrane protein
MDGQPIAGPRARVAGTDWRAWLPYGGIAVAGALLRWMSDSHPGRMAIWAPWEFSAVEYLSLSIATLWFFQGLARTPAGQRPKAGRRAAFLAGVGSVYLVLQTRYDYWAQHLFLLNRVQHVVMHHLGPFFIALGGVGEVIDRGMPGWARRAVRSRAVAAAMRVLQQPVVAGVLFIGSFFFWLIPPVHFRAMIDDRLYQVMNWTMVVDGILFWVLVLDLRPRPPARTSYAARLTLVIVAMVLQTALGALLAVWPTDLYAYYDLCGRLFPSIGELADQHFGGVVIWIPTGFFSMGALVLLVINMPRPAPDRSRAPR